MFLCGLNVFAFRGLWFLGFRACRFFRVWGLQVFVLVTQVFRVGSDSPYSLNVRV